MSVIVTGKFHGDTAAFRRSLVERAEEYVKIAERAKSSGGIHHRFGIGDGYVLIVDEWESPQHFEEFFADPSLQEFIVSVGAAPQPPEITVCEAVTSPDQY